MKHNHFLLHLAFNAAVIFSPFPSVIISALIASRWAGVALLNVTFVGLNTGFTRKWGIGTADGEIGEVIDINHIIKSHKFMCEEMQKKNIFNEKSWKVKATAINVLLAQI